ncbi:hypothetical protein WJX72_010280 [[Myrmecia] bisecta]|uniref:CRC domain-containing protein n=1 Tax=[Myrmecia] bisecta TaxID=41462 RepID=A0AAW1P6D7_9CHLO
MAQPGRMPSGEYGNSSAAISSGPSGQQSQPAPMHGSSPQQGHGFPTVKGAANVANLIASPGRRHGSGPGRAARPTSAVPNKKHCNCKNSRCLKLYCECFASGRYCEGCNCVNCCNNRENENTRQAAIEAILERNPNAFRPKIQAGTEEGSTHLPHARHNKGCNCKKSGCLKKYCECFQAGIFCSDNCKCIDCKNFEGSEPRESVIAVSQDQSRLPLSPHSMKRQRVHPPTRSAQASPARPLGLPPAAMQSQGQAYASQVQGYQSQSQRYGGGAAQHAQQQAAAGGAHSQVQSYGAPAEAAAPVLPVDPAALLRGVIKEMVKRGGIEEMCSLLLLVSQEEQERLRKEFRDGLATQEGSPGDSGLLSSEAQPGGESGELQVKAEPEGKAQQQGQGPAGANGGCSELYEAQERAVLQEYHYVLKKIIEKVQHRLKEVSGRGRGANPNQGASAPPGFVPTATSAFLPPSCSGYSSAGGQQQASTAAQMASMHGLYGNGGLSTTSAAPAPSLPQNFAYSTLQQAGGTGGPIAYQTAFQGGQPGGLVVLGPGVITQHSPDGHSQPGGGPQQMLVLDGMQVPILQQGSGQLTGNILSTTPPSLGSQQLLIPQPLPRTASAWAMQPQHPHFSQQQLGHQAQPQYMAQGGMQQAGQQHMGHQPQQQHPQQQQQQQASEGHGGRQRDSFA